jgi:hypothetical protein
MEPKSEIFGKLTPAYILRTSYSVILVLVLIIALTTISTS